MGWIFGGFIFAIFVEMLIRVLSGYEPQEKQETKRVQVSLPWYGWGLAAYGVAHKSKKRRSK